MYRKTLTLCLLCYLPAHADLPLTVEDSGAVGGAIGGIPWGAARMGFYGGTIGFMGNSTATSSWGRR